mmetsp:Transcript_30758/g.70878  ORF Transcript_30758/g.70878 Transcript_30758/m.70878 type:complete len:206 (+) Transcript_30758:1094-1711(+)
MFKSQHGEFRENRITACESSLRIRPLQIFLGGGRIHHGGDMIEWSVFFFRVLVLHNRMAVAKGTTLHILSGDAHVISLNEQSPKGHGFRRTPINAFALFGHLTTSLEDLLHLAMQLEILGDRACLESHTFKDVAFDTRGTQTTHLPWSLETFPPGRQPIIVLLVIGLAGLKITFIRVKCELTDLLAFFLGQGSLFDKTLLEKLQR